MKYLKLFEDIFDEWDFEEMNEDDEIIGIGDRVLPKNRIYRRTISTSINSAVLHYSRTYKVPKVVVAIRNNNNGTKMMKLVGKYNWFFVKEWEKV